MSILNREQMVELETTNREVGDESIYHKSIMILRSKNSTSFDKMRAATISNLTICIHIMI